MPYISIKPSRWNDRDFVGGQKRDKQAMDGGSFRNMNLSGLFSWPVLVIFMVGLAAIACSVGLGAWWVFHHLQWVS